MLSLLLTPFEQSLGAPLSLSPTSAAAEAARIAQAQDDLALAAAIKASLATTQPQAALEGQQEAAAIQASLAKPQPVHVYR